MTQIQEQVVNETFSLAVEISKLTVQELAKALDMVLDAMKSTSSSTMNAFDKLGQQKGSSVKYQGLQTAGQLFTQGKAVSQIEVNDKNIGLFKQIAGRYGIDFSVLKKSGGKQPTFRVLFKEQDSEMMVTAFKSFTDKVLQKEQAKGLRKEKGQQLVTQTKKSLKATLNKAKMKVATTLAAAELNKGIREFDRGQKSRESFAR